MGLIRGMARTAVAAGTDDRRVEPRLPAVPTPPEKLAVNRRNA